MTPTPSDDRLAYEARALLPMRLYETRRRRGLTQMDLSVRSGVTCQNISNYETGRSVPHLLSLARLARALYVSTDFLLGLADVAGCADPRDRLTVSDRAIVDALVSVLIRRQPGSRIRDFEALRLEVTHGTTYWLEARDRSAQSPVISLFAVPGRHLTEGIAQHLAEAYGVSVQVYRHDSGELAQEHVPCETSG